VALRKQTVEGKQMKFMPWPEIEGFHNIRKFIRVDPGEWWHKRELLAGTSVVSYKAKVKLHGTNAAVRIDASGNVTAQSRANIITPENDNAGFARWVKANEEEWKKTAAVPTKTNPADHYLNMVFFGEWIGPGIQKNVAVSEIPKKCFAVFAMKILGKDEEEIAFEVRPDRIALYLGKSGVKFACAEEANLPDVYVLPWYEQSIDIDWKQTDEELTKTIAPINDWVMAIEANDPWVEATFGVKGTGEGLVFYPISDAHTNNFEHFTNLCFKAKGEKHKNIATGKAVQVSAEAAASIDAFVSMVLTPARLDQGARAILGEHKHEDALKCLFCTTGALTYDMKNTGKFVNWVSADVEKETQDELAASGLTWKEVQKPVSDKARAWFLAKAKGM
jgi:hypothetical protein